MIQVFVLDGNLYKEGNPRCSFLRERTRRWNRVALSGPEIFFRPKTVCFHLKGGLVTIFPCATPRTESRVIFHPFRSPATGADVGDHFIKLLYYSSGPCGGPGCPFSEAIFYCDICRGGLGPLREAVTPYFVFRSFFLSSSTLILCRILVISFFNFSVFLIL